MITCQILHLEDSIDDGVLIERALRKAGLNARFVLATSPLEFVSALQTQTFDLILSDNGVLGLDAAMALQEARKALPNVPFICVTGSRDPSRISAALAAGVTAVVSKEEPAALIAALHEHLPAAW